METTIHQRINQLRRWIVIGDPQLEPEWDDIDLDIMEIRGLSQKEYAIECIIDLELFIHSQTHVI